MHKILLNSVLLSPILSPAVSDQTPLGHNPPPPCFLPFVGRLGSGPRLVGRIGSVVRVSVSFLQNTRRVLSYDVLRQQKTCCVRGEFDLRLRRITSSPSQTLRRRLVRTTNNGRRRECSARRLPLSVSTLFFTLRDSYG